MNVDLKGMKTLQKKFDQIVTDLHGDPMRGAMAQATMLVTRDARRNAPVDTGTLRASIVPEVVVRTTEVTGIVGSNVKYACIFGAAARIHTVTGLKTIGQVQIGDMVLTQSGDYRLVVGKSVFPATEKPNLVDIEVYWRKDRNHRITVTADHKILVFQEGRSKWILAGDLRLTDELYIPRIIPHNKRKGHLKKCLNCEKNYRHTEIDGKRGTLGQGKKFCSQRCKNEYWHIKGNNPHIGMKRTQEARERMSRAAKRKFQESPQLHPNIIMSQKGYITDSEQHVKEWLDRRGLDYIHQKNVGRHIVDFYVPEIDTIYEADGAYWHQDQAVDIARDMAIREIMPDVRIVHLHFFEKRFSPILEHRPMPDVYYAAINPNPDSYANAELFQKRKIVRLKHWEYKPPLPGKGRVTNLYDLTVEGIHSFFANGILVSNSHMEFGTRPFWPPWRPLFEWASRKTRVSGGDAGALAARARIAIATKGIKARRYLQSALEDNAEKIFRILGDVVGRIVSK